MAKAYFRFEVARGVYPRQDLIRLFGMASNAEFRRLTFDEFWRLVWVFDPNNGVHVTMTDGGANRLLRQVGAKYSALVATGYTEPGFTSRVDECRALALRRQPCPPIFVGTLGTGEPSDGSFYIADGIARSTALASLMLEGIPIDPPRAYIAHFSASTSSPQTDQPQQGGT